MTRLYLAAPLITDGYRALRERLITLSDGLLWAEWATEVVYPHGRTQPEAAGSQPSVHDLRCVAQRLIYGGGEGAPPATRMLAVGSGPTVYEQRQWAELAGVPCADLYPDEEADLMALGARTLEPSPVSTGDHRVREIRSVGDVLRAYFGEAERVMGMRAMPIVMVGGSSPYRRRERQEIGALRMAQAAAIIHEAQRDRRWDPAAVDVLRVLQDGGTARQAALAAGHGGGDAERWALRVQRGAVTAIAEAMRERRVG